MTMKIILASNTVRAALALVAASALSACAPNPQVVPDAVYHRYPQPQAVQPPRVNRPAPVQPAQRRPITPARPTIPLPPEQAPVVVSEPILTPIPEAQLSLPPKKYVSSPAARALRQQAQTEMGQDNVAGAVATIERALRIEPENPDLWLALSELNKQQGNAQQAASMAAKAQYYQESLH